MDDIESIIRFAYLKNLLDDGKWLFGSGCFFSAGINHDPAHSGSGYVLREYRLTALGPDEFHDTCNAKGEVLSRAPETKAQEC
ncbi:hypothetical protein SAMN05444064_10782 [Pseudomonas syringae]|uniref:hypothetical protein n=1 Tax=Pseudomonas syringae TaxID=317 RepID=UPI00089AB8D8|nr:hypothetical protein [Pseudomonas syringae]SDW82470.1 hypothetical protein SAMN05444514_107157 [Pseudomonas syringae]SFL99035.1 hypothetical protein SAMN05444064_10782 [Pseudomonas syringae]